MKSQYFEYPHSFVVNYFSTMIFGTLIMCFLLSSVGLSLQKYFLIETEDGRGGHNNMNRAQRATINQNGNGDISANIRQDHGSRRRGGGWWPGMMYGCPPERCCATSGTYMRHTTTGWLLSSVNLKTLVSINPLNLRLIHEDIQSQPRWRPL